MHLNMTVQWREIALWFFGTASSPVMTPLPRAFEPLLYRPLFWLALAALCGVGLGERIAHLSGALDRSSGWLLSPLLPGVAALFAAWRTRSDPVRWRLAVALAVTCLFATYTARRILPPPGDISSLTVLRAVPLGPVRAITLVVHGHVADYPRRTAFNVSFPLALQGHWPGRLWIEAPYAVQTQVGDEFTALVELHALPTPGNPGEVPDYWRAVEAGCYAVGKIWDPKVAEDVPPAGAPGVAGRIVATRDLLFQHYLTAFRNLNPRTHPFPEATAHLLTAMIFGEGGLSQPLPVSLAETFRAAGMAHLLVSSGTQVGFVVAGILWLARTAGLRRWTVLAVLAPLLLFYVMIAGDAPSILRAGIAGLLIGLAVVAGREVDNLSLWSAALLLLLTLDPAVAWNISFQLTFAGTWGLIALAPAWARFLERHAGPPFLVRLAAFSLAAQLANLPVSLAHFGTFSIQGLCFNWLVIPLSGLLVATGTLGLVFNPANAFNYWLTRGFEALASWAAGAPASRWQGSGWPAWGVALFYLACLASLVPLEESGRELATYLWAGLKRRWAAFRAAVGAPRSRTVVLGALLLLALVLTLLRARSSGDGRLHVTMLDAGEGESILIRSPAGRSVLIDGGTLETGTRGDIANSVIVPALQSYGVDRIDLLVLTAADPSHCNGLTGVVNEVPVGLFLDGPSATQARPDPVAADYVALRRALAARGVPFTAPAPGESFDLGDGARLTVIAPRGPAFAFPDDNGVVMRLDYGANSFLFPGDIGAGAEQRLLDQRANLRCTVLKVPRHGAVSSLSQGFLKAASPRVALISCGKYNTYGHPDVSVLRNLDGAGAAIFRTDISGAIDTVCERSACEVRTFR